MILAAGLGIRLRPLTERTPKALVEVAGVPMIERVARRLAEAGADRIIVNVHHHAELVERFLDGLAGRLGVEIAVSREDERPLDTGGGLLRAAPLFRADAPFFLHNVDVLSEIDLGALYRAHERGAGLATLAVHDRETSRFLLLDEDGLFGWENTRAGTSRASRVSRGAVRRAAFTGIHVVSPEIFARLTETGVFSILDAYLRLAAEGRPVSAHDVTGAFWFEMGTPERLARAESLLRGRAGRGDGSADGGSSEPYDR